MSRLYELLPQAPARPARSVQPVDDPLLEVPDLTGIIDLGDGTRPVSPVHPIPGRAPAGPGTGRLKTHGESADVCA